MEEDKGSEDYEKPENFICQNRLDFAKKFYEINIKVTLYEF